MELKVYASNKHFVVEWPTGKLHILNEKALKYNLRKLFGVTGIDFNRFVWNLRNHGPEIIVLPAQDAA